MKDEALKLALEALQFSGNIWHMDCKKDEAITAIKQACALDKKAENARELGLDYEPVQEPLEYWNAVEGWVKIDEVREHFDSVGCGTIYKTAGDGRVPVYTTPPAAPVEPDWKAEYLKSVESGCITLDELREARAELDATNKQVEILSDALAESRRQCKWSTCKSEEYQQVLAGQIKQELVTGAAQQEPFCFFYVENGEEYFAPKGAYVPDNAQPLYTTPPAQPAPVPDAIHHTDLSEPLEYIQGWNDCRQTMLEMMK
jgi:hypothetical protein